MKFKFFAFILIVFCFQSCIIKSLQPFYSTDKLKFKKELLGKWDDDKKGTWEILSMEEAMEIEEDSTELSPEELLIYNNYRNGYAIEYTEEDQTALFIAMPFELKGQLFLDFIPLEIEEVEANSLLLSHLLITHSIAKIDQTGKDQFEITWLEESKITKLLDEGRLRLSHEKIGMMHELVLTASTTELQSFLIKYMESDMEGMWAESDTFILKPSKEAQAE